MANPKPTLTKFGIHNFLESCGMKWFSRQVFCCFRIWPDCFEYFDEPSIDLTGEVVKVSKLEDGRLELVPTR